MARKVGSKDKAERKRRMMRNIKATGLNAAKGAVLGGLIGAGFNPNAALSYKHMAKAAGVGALAGGVANAGINELAWRAGTEGRKKAGYADADRLDIQQNPKLYFAKIKAYQAKEQLKKEKAKLRNK